MPARRLPPPPPILPYAGTAGAPPVEVQRFDRSHPLSHLGLHGHRFFELIFLERASGEHRIGSEAVKASPGDLFVIAPGEVHDARGIREPEGWLALFRADALDPARSDSSAFVALPGELLLLSFLRPQGVSTGHYRIPPAQRPHWGSRFLELEREIAGKGLGYVNACRALLELLLIDAARLAAEKLTSVPVQSRPLLTQVFQFIEARFSQPISLVDVARAVGKSPAYLTDQVRRQTGRSVLAWIIERRMAEARRLLLETEQDVGEIGEAVSYVDTGYFIRQFKKLHGVTPLAYRRAHR